ncbi:MAG: protein translocase subunit SecF [Actinomycetes bacterium]
MSSTGGLAHRLYTGQLGYDFVGRRSRWYLVSAVILLVCVLGVAIRGINLSIDFTGGSEFTVPTRVDAATIDTYRETVAGIGLPDLGEIKVSTIGDDQVQIATRALSAAEINQVTGVLAEKAGLATDQVTNNLIGASWGQQITQQGLVALVVFLVLVSLMIWAYFRDWKMSLAGILALVHDLVVTVGVYALLQFAFTPATLIAILSILGYSLYDTVVVFDKVRDNTFEITRQQRTFAEASNRAINQVLVRSINTTIIGVLPVAALLIAGVFILGTGPLKDVGLAMFVGMVAGAYSSLFLAAPFFVQLKEREPAMVEHRRRLARREARHRDAEAEPAAATVGAASPVVSSLGEPIDPTALATVRPEELREARQQPRRSSRADRRKDTR